MKESMQSILKLMISLSLWKARIPGAVPHQLRSPMDLLRE
jgi:hypothetical protein